MFGRSRTQSCAHMAQAADIQPRSDRCEECGARMSLRVCMTCGHVGCCESQQAHNTKHADATGHRIIKSMPLSDRSWAWCYACNAYV